MPKSQVSLQQYLQGRMDQLGLTPGDIEKRTGHKVSDTYVVKILRGASDNLTTKKLTALAAALDVPALELLAVAAGIPYEPRGDKSLLELAELWARLPARLVEKYRNVVGMMLVSMRDDLGQLKSGEKAANGGGKS